MSSSLSDLTPLFNQAGMSELGFRQGVVVAWNPVAHTNLVDVGGVEIPNVLFLGVIDPAIDVGSVIGLLRYHSTYFIIGRIGEI